MDRHLTTKEAARELDYHEAHVRRLIREGIIRAERVGLVWLISPQEVERIKDLQGPGGRRPKTEP